MTPWQKIESAPTGSKIRVAHELDPSSLKIDGFCPAYGEFDGKAWQCNVAFVCVDGMLRFNPTHWLPDAEGGAA